VNWDLILRSMTAIERANASAAAQRAHSILHKLGVKRTMLDIEMDLLACHANGCPLRLKEMALDSTDFDLVYDVLGIADHLDRDTGKLDGRFLPRYAQPRPVAIEVPV
jgi:hypothetical protein